MRPAVAAASLLLAAAAPARASGFLLYEQSARAIGQGSAVVAAVRDPSAAWFNPAALATLPGWGASASGALVVPTTRFSPAAGGDDASSISRARFVPGLFGHVPVHPRAQLGLGLHAPFGLVVEWPVGWLGAEQSLETNLRVLAVNPSLAVRLHDRVSVAAGASLLRGLVDLAVALPAGAPGGRVDLSGGAWGVAVNAAALYRIAPERLHLATTYRSRSRLKFEGDADFSPDGPGFEETVVDQRASAAITLPDVIALGVMVCPVARLELDAEINWVLWSTFDELEIDFERPTTPNRRNARSSVDPLTARLGAQWRWPALALAARAGVSFDESASRKDTLAPSAPDAHRLGVGAGIGYERGRFTVDVAYLYAHFFPADAAGPNARPEGTYRSRAHVLALTLGVR